MTRKQIKAMFVPGQRWLATRKGSYDDTPQMRTVDRVLTEQIRFRLNDGKTTWTNFPKAREVTEAQAGLLRFQLQPLYQAEKIEVKLELKEAA